MYVSFQYFCYHFPNHEQVELTGRVEWGKTITHQNGLPSIAHAKGGNNFQYVADPFPVFFFAIIQFQFRLL